MGTRLNPFAHGSRRAVDTCALSLKWSFQLLLDLGDIAPLSADTASMMRIWRMNWVWPNG